MAEVHHEPTTPAPVGALFRVLTAEGRDPAEVYTAIQEILEMAGHNVVTRLTAVIEAATARNEAALAEFREEFRAALAKDRAQFQTALADQKTEFQTALADQKAAQAEDRAAFQSELAKDREEFRAALAEQKEAQARDRADFQAALAEQREAQAKDRADFRAALEALRAESQAATAKLTTTTAELAVRVDANQKQGGRTWVLVSAVLLTLLGILAAVVTALLTANPKLFG